jgi:hypothetical protein
MNEEISGAGTDALNQGIIFTSNYKQGVLFGLTSRLGYEVIRYFVPYLRLGIEVSRDKLNVVEGSPTGMVDTEGFHTDWAVVSGIGAEMPILMIMGLSFRLEYDYHYKQRTLSNRALSTDGVTTVLSHANSHLHTAKIAFVWNIF